MLFGGIKEIDILRNMEYMLDASMSIHDIIYELSSNIKDKTLMAKLEMVDNLMVKEGYKFADALESAGLFEQYIPLIRTGQETGSLSKVIKEIVVTDDKINTLRRKIKTATLYPVILMFISVGLGYGISFLLEKVITALPEKDIKGTAAYSAAKFIVSYRGVIFPAYAALLGGGIWFIARNASRIPIVKNLFNTVTVGQAFKMISLCIGNGLPLRETFALTSMIVKEKRWRRVMEMLSVESQERDFYDVVDEMADFIATADLLIIKSNIKAMEMSRGFDFVGERKIADSYTMIERLSPIMQVVSYVWVGGQVIAIMSPLYALLIGFSSKV